MPEHPGLGPSRGRRGGKLNAAGEVSAVEGFWGGTADALVPWGRAMQSVVGLWENPPALPKASF